MWLKFMYVLRYVCVSVYCSVYKTISIVYSFNTIEIKSFCVLRHQNGKISPCYKDENVLFNIHLICE